MPFQRGVAQGTQYLWAQTTDHFRRGIADLVCDFYRGHWLFIACFDSGGISPGDEEKALGWSAHRDGILSPQLMPGMLIPCEQFDEWWVFTSPADVDQLPEYDAFVNHDTWTLRSIDELEAAHDSTWEKGHLDWLPARQEEYWRLVQACNPVAQISDGSSLVVLTKHAAFIDLIERSRL